MLQMTHPFSFKTIAMKLLTTLFLAAAVSAQAQKKAPTPALPDLAAMQKMSPAQLEAYKQKMLKQYNQQAKKISADYNIKIDETSLPDFTVEQPQKDIAMLSLIPKQPPTFIQLADGLRASKKALESVTPKPVLEEVQKITATQTPAQQQSASIAAFYSDKPAEALLLGMSATLQNTGEPTGWNNLAALYNLSGLSQKAIPILMTQLQALPNNPMLLNNMGQAYLNLGDMATAKNFLQQCLAVDPMNPEAAHSMGLIHFFEKQFDEGAKYFKRELQVTQRRSTLALLKQNGKPANLYAIRKRRTNLPQRNFFEEISLSKFVMPDLPKLTEESRPAQAKAAGFLKSAAAEMMFWMNASTTRTAEDAKIERYQNVSVYSDLVEELLEGLNTSFPSENLVLFTKQDIAALQAKNETYNQHLGELKCPTPPAGSANDVWEAYKEKCCLIKKPIMDAYEMEYNSFVSNRIAIVQPRWKEYINGLISIVQLDPSPGNKMMVYASVKGYFDFLILAWQAGMFLDPPMECYTKYTSDEATAIIESSRKIDFGCPGWMNLSIGLGVASLKANCSSFSIEGGEVFQGGYEKNFKTGTSTFSGGIGIGASFNGLLKASASEMIYVSFDQNNQFADFGTTGNVGASIGWQSESLITDGIGKLSGTIAGINGGYTLGINSGFSGSIKTKGILSDFIKLEYSSK
jgi:tetratricopeptide (TPR) repeat protein